MTNLDLLTSLLQTDLLTRLPKSIYTPIITNPPFIPLLNGRDLGLVTGSAIRPSLIYRSAQLTASPEGWETWLSKNVTTIVDFRHSTEREVMAEPIIPGIKHIWFEPTGSYKPDLGDFESGDGSEGWTILYLKYLVIYADTIRAVLEHIRDEGTPILYHCSAGRDRTGIMSGLLHSLAGTPEDVILHDFMLTRVGIEPGRGFLEAHARRLSGIKEEEDIDPEMLSTAVINLISLRATSWIAFTKAVAEVYGGWEGYVAWLGFGEGDVERIRGNLRREVAAL